MVIVASGGTVFGAPILVFSKNFLFFEILREVGTVGARLRPWHPYPSNNGARQTIARSPGRGAPASMEMASKGRRARDGEQDSRVCEKLSSNRARRMAKQNNLAMRITLDVKH
jgi:hypothetical protein